MANRRLEFQEVTVVLGVILRFLVLFAGESLDAVDTVPIRDRPEMANIALDLPPDLDAKVPTNALIIRHTGVDQELEILVRVLGPRAPMPDACDRLAFHCITWLFKRSPPASSPSSVSHGFLTRRARAAAEDSLPATPF